MLKFLKNLFSFRNGPHAIVTVDDEDSDVPSSNRINKLSLWFLCAGSVIAVIIIVGVVLRFTPLKSVLFNYNELEQKAEKLQHKVSKLEDTIHARGEQLRDMKRIILTGKEFKTTKISATNNSNARKKSENIANKLSAPFKISLQNPDASIEIPANGKLIENLFEQAPDFPAFYPVEGIVTRGFNINSGHYGIDIATSVGAPIKAIADGVIISEEWTFNYGYVVIVQHTDGIITVFKHVKTLRNAVGQVVRPGDIIGTVGNVGILSTGPHLHFEIWKNGIPQNPKKYLIKPTAGN